MADADAALIAHLRQEVDQRTDGGTRHDYPASLMEEAAERLVALSAENERLKEYEWKYNDLCR